MDGTGGKTGMKKAKPPVARPLGEDVESIKEAIGSHLLYTVGKEPVNATARDWFMAAAHTVRDRVTEHWMPTAGEGTVVDRPADTGDHEPAGKPVGIVAAAAAPDQLVASSRRYLSHQSSRESP